MLLSFLLSGTRSGAAVTSCWRCCDEEWVGRRQQFRGHVPRVGENTKRKGLRHGALILPLEAFALRDQRTAKSCSTLDEPRTENRPGGEHLPDDISFPTAGAVSPLLSQGGATSSRKPRLPRSGNSLVKRRRLNTPLARRETRTACRLYWPRGQRRSSGHCYPQAVSRSRFWSPRRR